jgi:MFS-type transporter involved in bile tolerance (Atg22 family)
MSTLEHIIQRFPVATTWVATATSAGSATYGWVERSMPIISLIAFIVAIASGVLASLVSIKKLKEK